MRHNFSATANSTSASRLYINGIDTIAPPAAAPARPAARDQYLVRSVLACGIAFHLALAEPSIGNSDNDTKMVLAGDPVTDPIPQLSPLLKTQTVAAPLRYLTNEEQKIFQRALRRSVRMVHKASGPAAT